METTTVYKLAVLSRTTFMILIVLPSITLAAGYMFNITAIMGKDRAVTTDVISGIYVTGFLIMAILWFISAYIHFKALRRAG